MAAGEKLFDLANKAVDKTADVLKDHAGGTQTATMDSKQSQLMQKTGQKAVEAGAYMIRRKINKPGNVDIKRNHETANRILLQEKSDRLRTSSDLPEKSRLKLERTEDKLERRVRKQYKVSTELRGGYKTDLRVEQRAKSKLYDKPKYTTKKAAGNMSRRTLHSLNRVADDGENGVQNAWFDTVEKAANAAHRGKLAVQTGHRLYMRRQERMVTKLAGKEDKIARHTFRNEYKSALRTARQGQLWKASNTYDRHLQKKAIKKKYMKEAIAQYQKAKKEQSTAKVVYNTGFSIRDKAKAAVSDIGSAVMRVAKSPVGKAIALGTVAFLTVSLLLSAMISAFMMLFSGSGSSSVRQREGGFPPEVEGWRSFVLDRCTYYNEPGSDTDLTQFVNAILATIQQESGGVSVTCDGDIMQDKACGNWTHGTPSNWDSFTVEEKSIDAGVRYFYTGMKDWGVTQPDDYVGLQMVAQGYNYGYDFLNYARSKGATSWTLDISQAFSSSKGGHYGHPPYGQEWLEKYTAGSSAEGGGEINVETGPRGVVETAQGQIGVCENPAGSNNVIYNTEFYGHAVQDGGGSTYPWCAVFVWWCFTKSGNGTAYCGGDKIASCAGIYSWAQANGRFVSANEATYGDLALFGSNEHVEIIVSRNSDGTFETIGGNTGSGSQSNGGTVAAKTRSTSGGFPITSFVRPQY